MASEPQQVKQKVIPQTNLQTKEVHSCHQKENNSEVSTGNIRVQRSLKLKFVFEILGAL